MSLDFLFALPRFTDQGGAAFQPGLERMEALMEAMGRPHRAYPCVHVAGTNGKGSTSSMIAAIGTAAGRRMGLHTSPHLFEVGERMRVDGVPASSEWLAAAVARYRPVMEAVRPSFFEATAALSFLYFAESGVDAAVVEVGLGGRLDATNVVSPVVAVITTIGLDHTELLGETLPAIAREKAGIVKPGVPVLAGAGQPEVVDVLREAAVRQQAPFHLVQDETHLEGLSVAVDHLVLQLRTPARRYGDLVVGLAGAHQALNARLAVRAAELAGAPFAAAVADVYAGLREVRRLSGLRGRLDVLRTHPLVVADVGHNPEGLAVALAFLQEVRPSGGALHVLFGALRDKDVDAMARLLAAAGAVVIPVPLSGERGLSADALAERLRRAGVVLRDPLSAPDGLALFLRQATPSDALLLTGSHQVVAQLPPSFLAISNTKFP